MRLDRNEAIKEIQANRCPVCEKQYTRKKWLVKHLYKHENIVVVGTNIFFPDDIGNQH